MTSAEIKETLKKHLRPRSELSASVGCDELKPAIVSLTKKGCALLAAFDSGLIQENSEGVAVFNKFWDIYLEKTKIVDSYGFSAREYSQIILFRSEETFKEVVAANPNMTAIIGADDHTKEILPGVFLAGVTAN